MKAWHRAWLPVLAALALMPGCRPGEPVPTAPSPGTPGVPTGREPLVRVGIVVDQPGAVIGAPAAFSIDIAGGARLANGAAGETWTVTATNGTLEARSNDGRTTGPVVGVIRISAPGDVVTIGDRTYRGEALVTAREGDRITVVNALDLETYLLGVVPREIGSRPDTEIEAVKAQAVAARTYAVGNMGVRSRLGFDFHATVQDQVYGGLPDEDPVATRAVRDTRGVIATYEGRPILAYYSSTCGGRTANIEDAWPWRAALPYLRSVSDADERGATYCDFSNRYRWSQSWSRAQLLEVLGETLVRQKGAPTGVRSIGRVDIVERSPSGTVSIDLQADGREYRLRADSLRWVLRPGTGPAILNSARLSDVDAHMVNGAVDSLHIEGMGWGHAVGMCQIGAIGRARAGHGYDEILKAYYTGIELTTLY